jgi:hypothetical protein
MRYGFRMHLLLTIFSGVLLSQFATASTCPATSQEAFRRFEQIQSVNAAVHALSGRLLVSIQPIAGSPQANGASKPEGQTLQYTVDHDILPGRAKIEPLVPVGNSPKPNGSYVYGIEKLLTQTQDFAKTLMKSGVSPLGVSEKFKPLSYISHAMFYVAAETSEAQVLERNGKNTRVFHYNLRPKPLNVIRQAGEKREPAQFAGEIWLDAENCMPILMSGALEDTRWAKVDKFEVEFAAIDSGFYPTRMYVRTFVSGWSKSFSFLLSAGQETAQATEMSIVYQTPPNFRLVHSAFLEKTIRR